MGTLRLKYRDRVVVGYVVSCSREGEEGERETGCKVRVLHVESHPIVGFAD